MRTTLVTILRPENTTLVQHLPVQVDQMSEQEMATHASLNSYHVVDSWRIYTHYLPIPAYQIKRGDVLQDEVVINPDTNAAYLYRVTGLVKTYEDHQECVAETARGN